MKTFAESPRGRQLDFLLHSERLHYKLGGETSELTNLQITFMVVCAERLQREMDALKDKEELKAANQNTSPLSIVDGDSPEIIKRKIELLKGVYG